MSIMHCECCKASFRNIINLHHVELDGMSIVACINCVDIIDTHNNEGLSFYELLASDLNHNT